MPPLVDRVPIEVVQDILGRVNILTTTVYVKSRERGIAEAVGKHFSCSADAAAKREEQKQPPYRAS